jgi:hypothetical protein
MSQLLDTRYGLCVTAASSSGAGKGMSVALQLDVQHPTSVSLAADAFAELPPSAGAAPRPTAVPVAQPGGGQETVRVDLTLPHFYQLLSTVEEAKAALASTQAEQ